MISTIDARISELYVHRVGNQLRNEGIVCSPKALAITAENRVALTNFLLGRPERLVEYELSHSFDAELNSVGAAAGQLSEDRDALGKISSDLAKHLYSVSDHPRTKAGNLFVALLEGVTVRGRAWPALGIFKSDAVSEFIKTEIRSRSIHVEVAEGAPIGSLDKSALVSIAPKTNPRRAYAASARGEDAVFWNDRFLQLKAIDSAAATTRRYLDLCRAFAGNGATQGETVTDRILFLNRSLQYFEDADSFEESAFRKVFAHRGLQKEFHRFKTEFDDREGQSLPTEFPIEKAVVRNARRQFERNVVLDKNIEVRLRFKDEEEMNERVEHGFDSERGLAYIKLYYTRE